ncbi:MAG: AAA family ATPase [Actinomycetota bacterium]
MSEERPSGRAQRWTVLSVEPDERIRTRMTIELAGIAPAPAATIDDVLHHIIPDEPTVVLCGPGFASEAGLTHVQRISRAFPEAGVVLLADELTLALLQSALRSGVRDALTLDAGDAPIRAAIDRVGEAMAGIAARAVAAAEVNQSLGRVMVSFSTKGGVGKSVVSTNLAVALATEHRGRVCLVDADLQFGDVAVLLAVPPLHTTMQAAGAVETADPQLMEGLLATHEASGLRVLCAPIEPSAGDSIRPEVMISIVKLLRKMFDFIVVDMPPHFDDVVLALLEEADDVLLVASMDIPSIKNLKVGIQTLDLMSVAGSKLRLVLNRANARVNLDVGDVERALGVSAEFRIPSDISVPQAVNRGVPVVLDRPRSAAALALRSLADSLGAVRSSESTRSTDADPEPDQRRRWRQHR